MIRRGGGGRVVVEPAGPAADTAAPVAEAPPPADPGRNDTDEGFQSSG